ncbi:MAG: hypothetical protein MK116_10875 [Phycisphaerales bacterium]|nr:hypothetical protein [Phycisphaerales bacterium]
MRRFFLGAFVGVIIVAVVVTFMPDRAHSLIDQAGEVRGLLEDVVNRLDRLESRDQDVEAVEIMLPENQQWTTRTEPAAMFDIIESASAAPAAAAVASAASPPRSEPATIPQAAEVTNEAAAPLPPAVGRQVVDFDKLAAGLSRVSGALERLNRTMKPGSRRQGTADAKPSS